jgi:exopolysaccharide/PEP-CTERM locus tyrosine autokinase
VVPAVTAPAATPREPPTRKVIGNTEKSIHIDFDALRQSGLLPPEHQQRQIAHQYRTFKRPLLKAAFDDTAGAGGAAGASPRTIMVTSALPGEGKTFTSINLALSLALEKDHSVILIDGDAPKPHVSHTFGVAREPGILDVLTNPDIPVESVILPTDISGLYIVPIGHRTDTTTEHLSSARMRRVVAQLEALDDYGLVLFDSPPILLTSEAQVLASLFGQVVLVVRAGVTPQQAVTDSLAMIGEGPRVGLVLNQALHDNNVGGYYGYGYGDGFVESQQAGQHES